MWKSYLNLPRTVYLLCVGTIINRAGTFILPMLTIYLHKHLGLSEAFATTAMSAFGVGALVAASMGGHLADVVGRRATMLISLVGGAVVMVAFGYLHAPASIIGAVFLLAVIAEMYRPAASAMLTDVTPPERRADAFGLMYVSINLGAAIGPALAGYLFVRINPQWLFYGDAATTLLYAGLIALTIRETLPGRTRHSSDQEGAPVEHPKPTMGLKAAASHMLRDAPFVLFCLATLAMTIVYIQAMTTLPLYLQQYGLDADRYGSLVAVNGLMICTLQVFLTAIVGRWNRWVVLAISPLFVGLGFGLTGVVASYAGFVLTVVIWTVGEMMFAAVGPAIVGEFAPVHMRGRYMGAFGICFSGGNALGAPIGGWLLADYGGGVLWAACAAACGLSSVMYLALYYRVRATNAVSIDSPSRTAIGSGEPDQR